MEGPVFFSPKTPILLSRHLRAQKTRLKTRPKNATFVLHGPHHHEGGGELPDGVELAGDDGDLDLALGRLEVVGHQVAGTDVLGRLEYSKKKNLS